MANFRLATATQNQCANDLKTLIDAGSGVGTIKIYDGTQPASANTAVGAQTLLATITFAKPSFGASVAGVITAAAIAQVNAVATGTATWARIADSAGNTVFDCDVGASGATINLNTVAIVISGPVVISSFTITVPTG